MRIKTLALAAALTAGIATQPALAQDTASDAPSSNGTTFRGIRVEGDLGADRFQSEGNHHDKLGYGATVGFDGTIGQKIVIGAEGSYWRANNWNQNCTDLSNGNSICHKAFEEWGAAIRAGYLVKPDLLVFAKGGYVNREQRRSIADSSGNQLVYDHYRADGYQLGGGVEYSLTHGRLPIYMNAQYVYANYHGHSADQRLMTGVGIRFK